MSELLKFLCENLPQFRKSRLPALYSDFEHLRITNPEGYAANVSAWLQGLAVATRSGVTPTIDKRPNLLSLSINEELLNALENEKGRPLSIGIVIREGIGKGQLIPRQKFMNLPSSIYEKSWVQRQWQVLTQGLKLYGIYRDSNRGDEFSEGEFVVLENIEAAATKAKLRLSDFRERCDRIFTRTNFTENFERILESKYPLSESDMELFLKFLARDMGVISYNSELVKLRSLNDKDEITSHDSTIASLKKLIEDLNIQIEGLTQKYGELTDSAKNAASRNNRNAALVALKSRKIVDQTIEKRYATLAQLENTLSKIVQASTQVEFVKIIEASTEVLITLNKETQALAPTEGVFDKLQDQIQLVDELDTQTTLGLEVDEDMLDLELQAIERDQQELEELETKAKLDTIKAMDRKSEEALLKASIDSEVQKKVVESTDVLENLSKKLDTIAIE
ncbi:putative snf7 family protein [Erysiphe necator]|uniref:Putative snf7 family protein n=1 Tax=Uncinula necator TaxID=52586 RepID=A0A0B1PEI8_UNCNE|nr:putative snf7 family protein [Erysiphe necator]